MENNMTDYRIGLLLGLTIGVLLATSVTSIFLYKNNMIDYCGGTIETLVVLDDKNQGVLYLHCKGNIYESPLNVSAEAGQSQQISYSGGM
jgi:ABC-type lipoprotein release transport system permease subunit